MTTIEDLLGKPFITYSGEKIPEYALPIIKAYYKVLPLENPENFQLPITDELAKETIAAVENTLKKLNGGVPSRDLALLSKEEYDVFTQKTLPEIPVGNSVIGSAKYHIESEQYITFAYQVWGMVKNALNVLPSDAVLENIVDSDYKRSSYTKGFLIWVTQTLGSIGSFAGTIPLGYVLDSGIPMGASMVACVFSVVTGPVTASGYENVVRNKRKKRYVDTYKETGQDLIKQQLESFILQEQGTANSSTS